MSYDLFLTDFGFWVQKNLVPTGVVNQFSYQTLLHGQQLAIKRTQKLYNEPLNSDTIIKSKNTHLPQAER